MDIVDVLLVLETFGKINPSVSKSAQRDKLIYSIESKKKTRGTKNESSLHFSALLSVLYDATVQLDTKTKR